MIARRRCVLALGLKSPAQDLPRFTGLGKKKAATGLRLGDGFRLCTRDHQMGVVAIVRDCG
jgi:hypothetical protein